MAFSVGGPAELAALTSRIFLTRVLLNRGTHCCNKKQHYTQAGSRVLGGAFVPQY